MDLTWTIPLETPPQVVNMGRNAHGFQAMDRFCLPDLWSLHLYGYEASLHIDGVELSIRPGHLGITPPGKVTEYRYRGISVHIYAHFRLPADGGCLREVAAMQNLGEAYDATYQRLFNVIGLTTTEPQRVSACLWDLLWEGATMPRPTLTGAATHPAVHRATEIISRELASPLKVADIAAEVGVSFGYLARLFQEAYGETVIAHLRRRRLERALHLLQRSTLPIKSIASTVGIPDIQHFNKAIRAQYGSSPRTIRQSIAELPKEADEPQST